MNLEAAADIQHDRPSMCTCDAAGKQSEDEVLGGSLSYSLALIKPKLWEV